MRSAGGARVRDRRRRAVGRRDEILVPTSTENLLDDRAGTVRLPPFAVYRAV